MVAIDNVNHPAHYTIGDIEVIDYIRDKLSSEAFQGYCEGNCLKYISRWKYKGGVEDLKKAQVYLGWMIENIEKNKLKVDMNAVSTAAAYPDISDDLNPSYRICCEKEIKHNG